MVLQLRRRGHRVAGELHTHERTGLRDAAVLGQQHHRHAGPTLCLPYRGRRWVRQALSRSCRSLPRHAESFLPQLFYTFDVCCLLKSTIPLASYSKPFFFFPLSSHVSVCLVSWPVSHYLCPLSLLYIIYSLPSFMWLIHSSLHSFVLFFPPCLSLLHPLFPLVPSLIPFLSLSLCFLHFISFLLLPI